MSEGFYLTDSNCEIIGIEMRPDEFFHKSELESLIIKASKNEKLRKLYGLRKKDLYVPHNRYWKEKYINEVFVRMIDLDQIQKLIGDATCCVKPLDKKDEKFLKIAACMLGIGIVFDDDLSDPEEIDQLDH